MDITQYLLQPKAYVVLGNDCVHLGTINDPTLDTRIIDENISQNLQPYTNKYDIKKYNGNIHISVVEGDILSLYYKEIRLMQHSSTNRDNTNFKILFQDIIGCLENLFQYEADLSRLSFQLKEKDILNQLFEFYRFLYLNPNKSYTWIEENIK